MRSWKFPYPHVSLAGVPQMSRPVSGFSDLTGRSEEVSKVSDPRANTKQAGHRKKKKKKRARNGDFIGESLSGKAVIATCSSPEVAVNL